ncbi:MAG: hypothetical protein U1F43_39080, partial [Myxococcota bacterium]
AGPGGNGRNGARGVDGLNGVAGTTGGAARNLSSDCNTSTAGGNGGARVCGGVDVGGGKGGYAVCALWQASPLG